MDRPHDVLAKMLIKVKTLTGKEIEIDIEPTDKVERIKVQSNSLFLEKRKLKNFYPKSDINNHFFRSVWKRRKASHLHSSVSSSLVSRIDLVLCIDCPELILFSVLIALN